MKRQLLVIALIFITMLTANGEDEMRIRLYYEETPEGWDVYIDNNEIVPVSVQVSFTLTNLRSSVKNNSIFLLPPGSNRNLISNLTYIRKAGKSSFAPVIKACFGDHTQNIYDADHAYYLPFARGESFIVGQGYNGAFTHRGENMLDFDMPEGTPVHAMRDGVVLRVVQHHNRGCKTEKCAKYNNYIDIYHSDGTFATYAHLRQNGSVVNEGDTVETGQLIGYSGNTGWSSGPHLHIAIYFARFDGMKTLRTKFLTGSGETVEYLKELQEYERNY
jgi:murein DD-endopeptidase MepM/ murein hydrolase activator NlpD